MKNILRIALVTLAVHFLSACSMTWVQEPPKDMADGSRIITIAYHKQYRGDSLRIDRTARDGSRSYYIVENLPANFEDYSLLGANGKSVSIRLLDAEKKVIETLDIPYSSFTAKGG